jgi:protein ImuA
MSVGQMFLFPLGVEPEIASHCNQSKQPPVASQAAVSQAVTPSPLSPLDQLRAQMQRIQAPGRSVGNEPEPCFSAGGSVLNAMLPQGGLRRGTIVQWVGDANDSGAASLATIAAAEIAASEISGGKPLVIFNCGKTFYPPAAISFGIPADRMIVVQKQPHHIQADMMWAIDQALRCDAVAAVWAEIGPWLNDRDARRLQLAAEAGGTVGLFVRPTAVRGRPSFADVSWYVSSLARKQVDASAARRLRVQVDRCRGGAEGATALVEINSALAGTDRVLEYKPIRSKHESTVASDLAHQLAHPKSAKRGSAERDRRDAKRAS